MKLRFYNEKKWFNHKTKESICEFDVVLFNRNDVNSFSYDITKKLCDKYNYLITIKDKTATPIGVGFHITGNSKTHPNDTPNATTGIHIAESRAKHKAYERGIRVVNMVKSIVKEFLEDSENFSDYLRDLEITERDHLEDIV